MLNNLEIEEVTNHVINKIKNEIDIANRSNELSVYLKSINCSEFYKCSQPYYDEAKILVFGASELSEDEMKKVAKSCGIMPDSLEFEIDYKKNKHYDFNKLKDNVYYSDIIFGPTAHKGVNIGNNSSALAMMESEQEHYPNVIRAVANNALKITRNSFEEALKKTRAYSDFIGY